MGLGSGRYQVTLVFLMRELPSKRPLANEASLGDRSWTAPGFEVCVTGGSLASNRTRVRALLSGPKLQVLCDAEVCQEYSGGIKKMIGLATMDGYACINIVSCSC
ncbi:hypothetical protein CDAR_4141 [Caerostris darwini]|uniref:Uncharacterized protein n=1 Tax=Caerostris darwini TaxID=1538125 RepID=A0AAV4N5J8_9ARAC|nr:hypothetical protein CDAR_4141 [Caerostris darwini]